MAYFPFRSNTERGVANLRWSLLLAFTMQILAAMMLVPIGYYLLYPPSGYFDPSTLTVIPMEVTVVILGIVAMAYFLGGLSRVHAGRDEYDPAHVRNAETIVIFTVIAFVVGVSGLTFGFPFGLLFQQGDAARFAVTGALSVVRGLFVGLAYAFAVRALVRPEETSTGTFAAIALAVGPAAGAGVSIVLRGSLPAYTSEANVVLAGLAVAAAIELVGYILLYRQYTVLSNRLRSGEMPPRIRPPAVPFVPYPAYPGYGMPVYPAYPAPPMYPPPVPPPQQPPPQARPPGPP